jgi:integrase/recombinase XerD
MALGRQAKILTDRQQRTALTQVATHRYAERDRVILLLSYRAGLRAKEIAHLTWSMVTDGTGALSDCIRLQDVASKGRSGRVIPLARELIRALQEWRAVSEANRAPSSRDLLRAWCCPVGELCPQLVCRALPAARL